MQGEDVRGHSRPRRRLVAGIRKRSDLGQQVDFKECRVELDNLPVLWRERFEVDRMYLGRVDVDRGHNLLAVGQTQCVRKRRIDLDRGHLLVPGRVVSPQAADSVATDQRRHLALAGHAGPSQEDGLRLPPGFGILVAEFDDDILRWLRQG